MGSKTCRQTSTRARGNRVAAAFSAAMFGLALCAGGPALLWWNEGRAISMERALKESGGQVVQADSARVEPENEGRLVHMTGRFEVLEKAADPELGFSLAAARLKRTVEMFQWQEEARSETKDKLGGGSVTETTHTYKGVWSSREINPSGFHKSGYANPGPLPFTTATFDSSSVRLGAFALSPDAVASLPGWEPVPADEQLANSLTPALSGVRAPVQPAGGWIFAGRDPVSPRVGDIRMRYEAILPKEISILAKQSGGALVPHTASNGEKILLTASGAKSAQEMIADAQQQNKLLGWALRGAGALILFLGMKLILGPLAAIAHVVPFLGRAAGFLSGVAAFILSLGISLMVIGIAWLAHRPVIGVTVLAGAVALTFWAGAMRAKAGASARAR